MTRKLFSLTLPVDNHKIYFKFMLMLLREVLFLKEFITCFDLI